MLESTGWTDEMHMNSEAAYFNNTASNIVHKSRLRTEEKEKNQEIYWDLTVI